MNEVAKLLHERGGKKTDDLFVVPGVENPLINEHIKELNIYQSDYYGYWVDSFIIHINNVSSGTE